MATARLALLGISYGHATQPLQSNHGQDAHATEGGNLPIFTFLYFFA
jgi:hypothetical protein